MTKVELIFIPLAAAGHIVSAVELAKLLIDRDERLSITVIPMKFPFFSISNFTHSVPSSRIRFIDLPVDEFDPSLDIRKYFNIMVENSKHVVKETVSKLISQSSSQDQQEEDFPKLGGFVVDMVCTAMIDVANDFGVPSYIFFASGAASLGLFFYMQDLHDEQGKDLTEFENSDAELAVPGLVNPVPASALPSSFFQKDRLQLALTTIRKYRETKGIIVNTFSQLEPYTLKSLADGRIPPVYPVGPILNLKGNGQDGLNNNSIMFKETMQWLDEQPPSSVVFLCFGSMGSFDVEQVREIASALENSGHRFLWSLRKPPPQDMTESPTDYSDPRDALPDGFLDRTADVGRVIGWAPQVDVLAHPSIGGFVSHCGWNSTLESIRFGVPIAAWPIYAEQQLNAFHLVVELGLGVEIKLDYRKDQHYKPPIVNASDIERGIRSLMDRSGERIKLLNKMSKYSKEALEDGGSSYKTIGCLIEEIMDQVRRNGEFVSSC
ncbi:hypothetical protein Tsubulata_031729 [Turnera subulata]|uniref:Glycosyltransferase n=1 Tax=Turnera subulata TaxID=218843 RepID=A0A9Q0FCH9_9ROSI|nr:hypothetical protein Tsubulata_031729 [Turnera subulata]